MLNNKLRQLAINTTDHGVIGVDDKLLFASVADLVRFAEFTAGTVMIAGRATAQQMIYFGTRLSHKRPLVVISENDHLTGTTSGDDKWIYYAGDLKSAITTAEALSLEMHLNGWTICGGKRVYDEWFDLMETKNYRLNSVYAFTHEMHTDGIPDVVKLNKDWNDLEKLIGRSMSNVSSVWHELDVLGKDYTGKITTTENPRAIYIYDKAVINPDEATLKNGVLRVLTVQGEVTLLAHTIMGYIHRPSVNSVVLTLAGGAERELRPGSTAGLNSLLFALNLHVLS